jgi:hypothetical protein
MKYVNKAIEECKVECVKCIKCGTLHSTVSPGNKEKFFSVHGNICIGLNGGIVGNNLTEDGQVNRVMIYCFNCLIKYLQENISLDRSPVKYDECDFLFGDDDKPKNTVPLSVPVINTTTADCIATAHRRQREQRNAAEAADDREFEYEQRLKMARLEVERAKEKKCQLDVRDELEQWEYEQQEERRRQYEREAQYEKRRTEIEGDK